MDMTAQIELERLFAKNQVLPRIKSEFRTDEVIAHCASWAVPLEFALDLLAQMHLHKRTTLSVLVGIPHGHFTDIGKLTLTPALQACADMIWHAAAADLIDFDPLTWMFVIRPGATISAEAQDDLDRYQYPLPMVIQPKQVTKNQKLNRWIHVAWLLAAWIVIQIMTEMLAGGQGVLLATPAHIGGFVAGLLLHRPLLLWRYRRA